MPQYALAPREAVPTDVVGGTACRRRIYAALSLEQIVLLSVVMLCVEKITASSKRLL